MANKEPQATCETCSKAFERKEGDRNRFCSKKCKGNYQPTPEQTK